MSTPASKIPAWKIGDIVGIRHWPKLRGRIVELRGPLGPNGMHLYRVRFRHKRRPSYSEVLEDQLLPLSNE